MYGHWNYCSLALSHWWNPYFCISCLTVCFPAKYFTSRQQAPESACYSHDRCGAPGILTENSLLDTTSCSQLRYVQILDMHIAYGIQHVIWGVYTGILSFSQVLLSAVIARSILSRCYIQCWDDICILNYVTIVSDHGLSPVRGQAIIWTNAGILIFGPLRTYFCEIHINIQH